MTEKNIFACKLFLSLNISDFNLFFVTIATLPEKSHPPLSQQPPSKSWGHVKLPLFENLVGGSTTRQEEAELKDEITVMV